MNEKQLINTLMEIIDELMVVGCILYLTYQICQIIKDIFTVSNYTANYLYIVVFITNKIKLN